MNFFIMQFPPSHVTSFILGHNNVLSTPLSDTFILCFLNMRDHVLHAYKIASEVIARCILISIKS